MLLSLASAACVANDSAVRPVRAALAAMPNLGAAESFALLAGSTVTSTGPARIVGDVGVSPGTAIVGFPPATIIGGALHSADAEADAAQASLAIAYVSLADQPCDIPLTGMNLGAMTLRPGVYCFASSAQLTGTLVLDGVGDPDAVFVFQIGSTLTTASGSAVEMLGRAIPGRVFWQIGSSATLGTGTRFSGNLVALVSITATTGSNIAGRALARSGAVTVDSVQGEAVPTVFVPEPSDAGSIDASTADADRADASAEEIDAGRVGVDGSVSPAAGYNFRGEGGCVCEAGAAAPTGRRGLAVLLVVGGVLVARRRRAAGRGRASASRSLARVAPLQRGVSTLSIV